MFSARALVKIFFLVALSCLKIRVYRTSKELLSTSVDWGYTDE